LKTSATQQLFAFRQCTAWCPRRLWGEQPRHWRHCQTPRTAAGRGSRPSALSAFGPPGRSAACQFGSGDEQRSLEKAGGDAEADRPCRFIRFNSLSIEVAAPHSLRLPSLTFALSPVNSHSESQQSFLRFPTLYSGHALLSW